MGMMRWQPFSELISLRQAMEKLFEDSLGTSSCILSTLGPGVTTPIDMYQTTNDVVVKAVLSSHSLSIYSPTTRAKISRNWFNILAVAPQITLP